MHKQIKLGFEVLEGRALMSHTLVVGHRGNSMHAPENTLTSMDQAFRIGADVVEVDIQFASDGTIVAMHDTAVDRTTDGTGEVNGMSVPQLKALDAGSWFSGEFVGERVPTLTEFLQTAAGRGIVYLDLKADAMGATIRQTLDELGLPDESIWTSANTEELAQDIHDHLSGTPVLWWGPVPARGNADYFEHMRSIGVAGFDLKWSELSRPFVRNAQANGMFFSTYTIDSAAQWRAALKLGLDAIETNDPGGLAKLIEEQSGQVTARLDAGRLVIQGDNWNNSVSIAIGSQPGSVRVSGIDGTLINGQSEPIDFLGVLDLDIALASGNDYLEIVDLLLDGGLKVDGARGNDRVSMRDSIFGGPVEFLGGAGSDWFGAERSSFNQIQFIAAGGLDTLNIGLQSIPNARANDFLETPGYSKVERLAS